MPRAPRVPQAGLSQPLDLFTLRPRASVTADNGIKIDSNYPPVHSSRQGRGSANPSPLRKRSECFFFIFDVK